MNIYKTCNGRGKSCINHQNKFDSFLMAKKHTHGEENSEIERRPKLIEKQDY